MTTIGFIGLGHMGSPMAANLLKAGHSIIALDILPAAIDRIVSLGGSRGESLSDLAKKSDVIITMLQTGQQVAQVCLGENGLFTSAKQDTLFIDCSSIDVPTSRELANKAVEQGFSMIDAPVSGGVTGAEAAALTFMVGGSDADFEHAKPILEKMGKTIVHTGANGNGQAAKICNNMILGVSMIAVSEAFVLGEKLGLSPEKLFEVSSHASGQCWSMTSYCPVAGLVPTSPANRNYQPGFTAAMMLKDLRMSQQMAQTVNASTPLGAEATAIYSMLNNLGYDQMDFSGVIQLIEGKLAK